MFLRLYFYFYRCIILIPIFIRVLLYGIFHPQVLFNFLFGVVTEVAEFHKRCGGPVKNFKDSRLYQDICQAVLFPKSNCFNVGFGNIRPMEAQVLGALVQILQPKAIFEIGTYNGFSTLHLAKNSPPNSRVYTLDLSPNVDGNKDSSDLKHDLREAHGDIKTMKANSTRWFHQDECRKKIVELFGDSRHFDFSPYDQNVDLVFIDANHSYSYVKSDTENALKMLSPGGVILWHDYDFIHPGIFSYLNELAQQRKIYYIERTRFALLINNE